MDSALLKSTTTILEVDFYIHYYLYVKRNPG